MRPTSPVRSLFSLLDDLDRNHISYVLARNRRDAISVCVSVPGERIEIDVLRDGVIEVSRFQGNEKVLGGQDEVISILEQYGVEP